MDRANTTLVEPGVKYFISCSLKQCMDFKNRYTNIIFNIVMFVLFVLTISGLLIYKYKGKMTPIENEIKNRKKQEYIVSKLQQMAHLRKNQGLITLLPQW